MLPISSGASTTRPSGGGGLRPGQVRLRPGGPWRAPAAARRHGRGGGPRGPAAMSMPCEDRGLPQGVLRRRHALPRHGAHQQAVPRGVFPLQPLHQRRPPPPAMVLLSAAAAAGRHKAVLLELVRAQPPCCSSSSAACSIIIRLN